MIDTEVRHVTPAGANIFAELGFDAQEAQHLNAALQSEISQALQLKQQLMAELSNWIVEQHLKQSQAAEILRVSRPRVSDVVNNKANKFTIDTLIQMLSRTGKTVEISVS